MGFKETMKQIKEDGHNMAMEDAKRMQTKEYREMRKNHYDTHAKLILAGIPCLLVGLLFPPAMLLAAGCFIGGLVCMVTHWKQINEERNQRNNINK